MATIECKLAVCISRLVEFELLLELKLEQKIGASLHTTRCKDTTSFKTVERLSVPVILGEYLDRYTRNSPFLKRHPSIQKIKIMKQRALIAVKEIFGIIL
jgi:hypothetical protein